MFSYPVVPCDKGAEELRLFKRYLSRLKANQPDTTAMDSVYAALGEVDIEPLMKEMAKALNLSADGHWIGMIQTLI